jgi:hypothetical protein
MLSKCHCGAVRNGRDDLSWTAGWVTCIEPQLWGFCLGCNPPKVAAFCRLFGAYPAHPRDLDYAASWPRRDFHGNSNCSEFYSTGCLHTDGIFYGFNGSGPRGHIYFWCEQMEEPRFLHGRMWDRGGHNRDSANLDYALRDTLVSHVAQTEASATECRW